MKYTYKQIEKFKEMYRNGILDQLQGSAHVEIIDDIIDIDKATILARCAISIDELIDIADSRYELGNLVETANREYNMRYPEPIEKQRQVNYKSELIALLGLRDWATKEDIINELSDLL